MTITREDPSQATSVTRVTSVGNVRKPKTDGTVTTLTPAVEGGRKLGTKKVQKSDKSGKRSLEEPEVSVRFCLYHIYVVGSNVNEALVRSKILIFSAKITQKCCVFVSFYFLNIHRTKIDMK